MKIFNITRYRLAAQIFSLFFLVVFWGYTIFFAKGFNFGIDFQAGLNVVVEVSNTDEEHIREILAEYSPQVQSAGETGEQFVLRIADDETVDNFQQILSERINELFQENFDSFTVLSEEYIGSSLATTLVSRTIVITVIAMVLILLYIWIRFKLNYAVSAIVAVFHDVLFLLGFIGALQLEFSTATIAAVLTIIGYSLNDTIVIFDRVRENARLVREEKFETIINLSISQSMSRTLITSITTLIAVFAILFFASGTIRTFALNLVVGVIVGTYSSIFIASPILLSWHENELRRTKRSSLESPSGRKNSSAKSSTKELPSSQPESQTDSPPTPIQQTAKEINEATERRARTKAKKKKKKK